MEQLCSHLPPLFIAPHSFPFLGLKMKGSPAGSETQILIREAEKPPVLAAGGSRFQSTSRYVRARKLRLLLRNLISIGTTQLERRPAAFGCFYCISLADPMHFTGIQVPILTGFHVRKLPSSSVSFY